MHDKILQRIKTVIATVLDIEPEMISDDASPGGFERWDSLRHMNIIMALEEEFEIKFTEQQMSELLNIKLILLVVRDALKVQ